MRQSHKIAVVAPTTALALCLFTLVPTTATPIDTLAAQQSSFDPPSDDPAICRTVIGIDFDEDKFSVGVVNSEDQVEIIPNEDGQNYTPSFVRVTDLPDGTRELLLGREAITRPLDARGQKAVELMRAEAQKRHTGGGRVMNFSLTVPDYMFRYRPDVAYGIGHP
ncbi:hypothetical protein BGX29_003168 [Mortierella sp. GBA35]|nr:hypothetical protein BGX29_003168 [Mortierella sp. GBA35]